MQAISNLFLLKLINNNTIILAKTDTCAKQTTHCEPQKGSNDKQIYTVACKTHKMYTIIWPSQHASKSFEISFKFYYASSRYQKLIQDQETKMWAILNPEI